MMRYSCLPILMCLVLASLCLAEKKQIKLKNGETIVGEVVEQTPEGIKVKRALATVFYPKDQIVSIEALYDLKEDYADRLAKLKKDDFKSQLALGRWALDNKLHTEAVKHLEAAVKIKSDERAKLLLRQAKAKLAAAQDASAEPVNDGASGSDSGLSSKIDLKSMISDEDIQRIRLCELGDKDRVNVEFRNDVVKRFLDQVRGEGDFAEKGADVQFRRRPASWQAKYIIDKVSPDDPLRDDIIIKTDPSSMKEFRSGVWRWISGNCATSTCHGAAKGKGGLKLWNVAGRNDNVDYTNFLILDSFNTKGLQVIRRDDPEDSLLLQYSLPETQAKHRHPKAINSAFSSKNAVGYKQTLNWILSLKRPLHPAYNLKSNPPHVMKRQGAMSGLPDSTRPPAKKGKDKPKPGKTPKSPF